MEAAGGRDGDLLLSIPSLSPSPLKCIPSNGFFHDQPLRVSHGLGVCAAQTQLFLQLQLHHGRMSRLRRFKKRRTDGVASEHLFYPRSPSVLTELLLLLRGRQGLCLTEPFSDKHLFFYRATTAFSSPFQFSGVFVTFFFFLHLHLLHIYSLSTSHHQSIWHLLRAPLLLLPVPVLFIMASPPPPPPFSNICWSASVTADLPYVTCRVPLFTVPKRSFITVTHTYTPACDLPKVPPKTQPEKHSRPLIADAHYAARISIKETSHQRLNASFKRHPGLHFNGTFTHHRV